MSGPFSWGTDEGQGSDGMQSRVRFLRVMVCGCREQTLSAIYGTAAGIKSGERVHEGYMEGLHAEWELNYEVCIERVLRSKTAREWEEG